MDMWLEASWKLEMVDEKKMLPSGPKKSPGLSVNSQISFSIKNHFALAHFKVSSSHQTPKTSNGIKYAGWMHALLLMQGG